MDSPCANGLVTFTWFMGQCLPCTCCFTQILLRQKVLEGDMHKYQCCQGYVNNCCFKAGSLGEESCPFLCLVLEAFFCSNLAVSASRMYVMDRYQLSSDPCDYRLIRLSNCLQMLSCFCDLLACACDNGNIRQLAILIDHLADLMYHCVSSCMTAQVSSVFHRQISKFMYVLFLTHSLTSFCICTMTRRLTRWITKLGVEGGLPMQWMHTTRPLMLMRSSPLRHCTKSTALSLRKPIHTNKKRKTMRNMLID